MKPWFLLAALAGPLACTAININFDPDEHAADTQSAATDGDGQTGSIPPETSTTDLDDTGGNATGGLDTGGSDSSPPPDTDDPPPDDDTGDPIDCEPDFGPLELTIINGQGLEVHPMLAKCSTSISMSGEFTAAPDGSLEIRYCPEGCGLPCSDQITNTVHFDGRMVVPPGFQGCGEVDLWSGLDQFGECSWRGITAFQVDEEEPLIMGTNERTVFYWPVADAKVAPMKKCARVSQCASGFIGLHYLQFADETRVYVGDTYDVDLGTGTLFTVTNHMALVGESCEEQVAWSGYREPL